MNGDARYNCSSREVSGVSDAIDLGNLWTANRGANIGSA